MKPQITIEQLRRFIWFATFEDFTKFTGLEFANLLLDIIDNPDKHRHIFEESQQ